MIRAALPRKLSHMVRNEISGNAATKINNNATNARINVCGNAASTHHEHQHCSRQCRRRIKACGSAARDR
jgi:hypothetical protein